MIRHIKEILFGKERVVIVHVHIFKNAGSTLDWILQKNFGQGFVDHREDQKMIDGGASYLQQYLIENPHITAISSHNIYFNPNEIHIPKTRIVPLYILRHPIERSLSVYKFEKKQDIEAPGPQHAKQLDFNDYILWRMTPDSGAILRNANTLFCAGCGRGDVSIIEYNKALKNLQETGLVGLVDRFDDSMKLFENHLKAFFPEIDMSYVAQNVNQQIHQSLSDKVEKVEKMLSKEALDTLYDRNKLDLKLYNEAQRLIDIRLAKLKTGSLV